MRVKFKVFPHLLKFRFEAGTSRGSFTQKETWFIKANEVGERSLHGWGEASPLKGLSIDYSPDYGKKLRAVLDHIEGLEVPEKGLLDFIAANTPVEMPSLRFGVETALLDLMNGGTHTIFTGPFSEGKQRIPINGLVWMGDKAFMQQQIDEKLKKGFNTIKMKVGAIDFDTELQLLEGLREAYTVEDLTLRVDANGAFTPEDVVEKLTALAALGIHSVEQPIKPGQRQLMYDLCHAELLPIALDEELIGINSHEEKKQLLEDTQPQYIILKPSLLGGIKACKEWIGIAESMKIGWWMTSMLESNIGLNAIAQFTALFNPELPQGLGTGQLYHNNIESPLIIKKGHLHYFVHGKWQLPG